MGDITNPFYPEVLEILASKLQTAGKRVVLFSVSRDEPIDQALAGVLKYQVDGLVIASALPGLSIAELSARAHAPVVLFNRTVRSAPVDSVCCDNFSGGQIVADVLLDSGHRRLAFIAGLDGASTSVEREQGFRARAVARTGEAPLSIHGSFTYEGGTRAAFSLFEQAHPPDAVFAANDIIALGALDALRKLGLRVPGDVSVIGFDDIAAASWPSYSLTTFQQPVHRMIEETLRILAERTSHPQRNPTKVLVPGRLIRRESARLLSASGAVAALAH